MNKFSDLTSINKFRSRTKNQEKKFLKDIFKNKKTSKLSLL